MKAINPWNTHGNPPEPSIGKGGAACKHLEMHPFRYMNRHNPFALYPRTTMVVFLILAIAAAGKLSAQVASTGGVKPTTTFIEKLDVDRKDGMVVVTMRKSTTIS